MKLNRLQNKHIPAIKFQKIISTDKKRRYLSKSTVMLYILNLCGWKCNIKYQIDDDDYDGDDDDDNEVTE